MAINRSNGGVTGSISNKTSHGGDTITNFKGSTTWTVISEMGEVDVTVVVGMVAAAAETRQVEQGGGGGVSEVFRTA